MENNEQNTDPHIDGFENCTEETKRLFAGCKNQDDVMERARELGYMTHEEFWAHIHKKIDEFYDKLGLP